jgi:hypothetical protein
MEKITSQNPQSESNPDVPYDYVLPYLNFAPMINHLGEIKFTASLTCKLGREIDGQWQIWPEVKYSESIDDISTRALEDPALATLAAGINQLLSDFLASRGV